MQQCLKPKSKLENMKSTLKQNDTKKGKKETVDKIEMQHDVTAVRQI